MTLRRAGIARKTELRRTPFKARKRVVAAARVRKAPRVRDTGPTPAQRNLVAERAGYACELCGLSLHDGNGWTVVHSVHHRQGRGMGGSSRPEVNSPANLMLLCGSGDSLCHGFVTTHPKTAEAEGWLVRHGLDPADVPVTVHAGPWRRPDLETLRVFLTADGDYLEVAA